MVFTLYWNDMGGEMGKCANVQMCKCENDTSFGECANVQMCEFANDRLLLLVAFAANVLCY